MHYIRRPTTFWYDFKVLECMGRRGVGYLTFIENVVIGENFKEILSNHWFRFAQRLGMSRRFNGFGIQLELISQRN
jgi:hypothetical protein